ncbi:MAG: exodeoxyribonuclease VII large subunit [Microbacteriaceae bacterium]|nr:exodeoxyribonuclease VII large subunit [Microbacteriaceae bacterium]MDR9444158.1 exodeoxyribonuclease VII large subunit [Microbacteriaceae bacterium]
MNETINDSNESQSKVSSEHSPWPVSALSKSLKDWIEKLGRVWVEGEISQINNRGGNLFAELRDLQTENSISIHAWKGSTDLIDSSLEQGDRVVGLIKPQFWAKNGRISMQVYELKKVGLGEILERLEKLRKALTAEGLTLAENKKPLPFLPGKVGLITGRGSDAEKDVLENSRLRWPEVQFEVMNTLVQGERAIPDIIFAIEQLDADPEVEVIIIARGGGSFQDLLIFSDEKLVRTAAMAKTPIVSAIGHENDRPVLDDVSDLRASTPTDAAKRVIPDINEERQKLKDLLARVRYRLQVKIDSEQALIDSLRSRPIIANPYGFIDLAAESIRERVALMRERIKVRLDKAEAEITTLHSQAKSLSPQLTLKRGYSLVRDENGKPIGEKTNTGQKLKIRSHRIEITATAEGVKEIDE